MLQITRKLKDATSRFALAHHRLPAPKKEETLSKKPQMLADSAENQRGGSDVPKLRTACENCRQSKVKCNISGKSMCTRCLRNGLQCQYGFANRSGKPKGSKNHATLRKLGELPDEKPPVRTFRSARNGTAAERRGSFSTRDLVGSNVDRTALENHVSDGQLLDESIFDISANHSNRASILTDRFYTRPIAQVGQPK